MSSPASRAKNSREDRICSSDITKTNAHILGCPGVGDHATIGMPDERLGERICTFIVAKPGCEPPTKEAVIEHLKAQHVQKRLWPERVELIERIPRTSTGKIRRFVLLEEIKHRMAQDDR